MFRESFMDTRLLLCVTLHFRGSYVISERADIYPRAIFKGGRLFSVDDKLGIKKNRKKERKDLTFKTKSIWIEDEL